MARSRVLHQVRHTVTIEQPNDPAIPFSGEFDIASYLSKKLGRTIKQNQNFRLVGWGAHLTGIPSQDLDGGASATVQLGFCPTTKYSKMGHKMLQDAYWKQSNFRKGLGVNSKYDEFEVSMFRTHADDRTSEVYVGGISDTAPETCTLYGMYDEDGTVRTISAEAMINAKKPVPQAGELVEEDLIFDDTVAYKPSKFTSHFPPVTYIGCHATHSASFFYDHDIGIDEIYDTQGISDTSAYFLPESNHMNVLAGRVLYNIFMLPRDDENILADSLNVIITLWIEGWGPLHYKPKRSRRRLSSNRKSRSRRTYRKRKR